MGYVVFILVQEKSIDKNVFDDVFSLEDIKMLFDPDIGRPSDANVVSEQSYNNISQETIAEAEAFDIPESLWPVLQGRDITYKDFFELSMREQQEALLVCIK